MTPPPPLSVECWPPFTAPAPPPPPHQRLQETTEGHSVGTWQLAQLPKKTYPKHLQLSEPERGEGDEVQEEEEEQEEEEGGGWLERDGEPWWRCWW